VILKFGSIIKLFVSTCKVSLTDGGNPNAPSGLLKAPSIRIGSGFKRRNASRMVGYLTTRTGAPITALPAKAWAFLFAHSRSIRINASAIGGISPLVR
jgi:hypothetical protein